MNNTVLDLQKSKVQLNNDLQMTTLMIKSVQSLSKSEKELNAGQNALENAFDKVSQLEEDKILEQQFECLTNYQKKLNKIQSTYVNNLQTKLETSLASLNAESKLVQQKTLDFEKQSTLKEKKHSELLKVINDMKMNQQKKDLMSQQFDQLVEEYEKNEVQVTNRMKSYVVDRNGEFKHLVQHFIAMQVNKHANCLQVLTELNQEIDKIK